ncbi:MAG: DUF1173 domain-containing protein, partial [Alphaproteobacteria bacterium]|nr:DUF1173 domain-containing protein [Alphaproteobacteria bacterium]
MSLVWTATAAIWHAAPPAAAIWPSGWIGRDGLLPRATSRAGTGRRGVRRKPGGQASGAAASCGRRTGAGQGTGSTGRERTMSAEGKCYRLGHVRFCDDAAELQGILARAHEGHARPLCQCCEAEPPMYVALINGVFHLKRMPGTGHMHDLACPSFDPPPELSGLGPLSGQAIVTDEAGDTMLRLGFSLSLRGSRPSSSNDEGEADTVTVTASPRRLRLLALLHYLWDAAGLTTWRKAYGRRSWWIVHRELCLATARARTRSGPLSDILFVP